MIDIDFLGAATDDYFLFYLSFVKLFLGMLSVGVMYHLTRGSQSVLLRGLPFYGGAVVFTCLFYWEYWSRNERVNKVSYSVNELVLFKGSGEILNLNPREVQRFWSVGVGRGSRWACYLLIKTDREDYKSVVVKKRLHSCKADADKLNQFFKKS